tara:strand:- start:11973 stop:12455 length:483 start_codon:yes stop_codon:yes gene_type:complete
VNIFYLDPDPYVAAQMSCDKHVVKMILESAQMLCTAHRELDDDDVPKNFYKKAHLNHPSTIWTRSAAANYSWLYDHFVGLCYEYTHRYGKIHMSDSKLRDALGWLPRNIRTGKFTEPPQCMPDEYKVEGDSITAYRKYYKGDKAYFAKWSKRDEPKWWNE